MKLKKLIFAGAMALIATGAFGQKHAEKSPEEMAEKMTAKMTEEFSLSEDQAEKLNAINLDFTKSAHDIRNNSALSPEEKKAQMEELFETRKTALKNVLTDEQIAQVGHKEREHVMKKSEFKQRTPEERAERRTEKLAEELNLTEDQKQKVEQLTIKVIKKIDVIKADSTMTSERKKEFIEGNLKDYSSVMKQILNEEQFKKFELIMEEKRASHKAEKKEIE